ncbi:MAG: hypothetical protein CMQ15_03200 [Gammaproteobacteria bacterium]|nr:hypothetical protein [Gammaproteobacteria bacterium]
MTVITCLVEQVETQDQKAGYAYGEPRYIYQAVRLLTQKTAKGGFEIGSKHLPVPLKLNSLAELVARIEQKNQDDVFNYLRRRGGLDWLQAERARKCFRIKTGYRKWGLINRDRSILGQ